MENLHSQHNEAEEFEPTGEPLKVMLSYYPGGLHFSCVICKQEKGGKHVAILAYDETKIVCQPCYVKHGYVQVRVKPKPDKVKSGPETEKDKRKADEAPRLVQSSKPVGKAKPQEEEADPLPLSDVEARQRQLEAPAIGHIIFFFEDTDVTVQLLADGRLKINGSTTWPLPQNLASLEKGILNRFIDEMALIHVRDEFIKVLSENAQFGDGARAFLREDEKSGEARSVTRRKGTRRVVASPKPGENGFAITRSGRRLAFIRATIAHVEGGGTTEANFLKPGPHWQQLSDDISAVEARRAAMQKLEHEAEATALAQAKAERQRRAALRHINRLPPDIDPGLAEACMGASRRIRAERQVAYERPVVLENEFGELTLLPITSTGIRLLLPFRLSNGPESLDGLLELVFGDPDPLPLLIHKAVPDEDMIRAWTCALLGFADATCIDIESAAPRQPRSQPRSPSPRHQQRASASTAPRQRGWPSHLEPVGHWAHYTGAFIAGHRRRLNDGQTASEEAYERARQVGILLRSNETWVRPHSRGVPENIAMRFRWQAPRELSTIRLSQPMQRQS